MLYLLLFIIGLVLGLSMGIIIFHAKTIGSINVNPNDCICEIEFTNDTKARKIYASKRVIFTVRRIS